MKLHVSWQEFEQILELSKSNKSNCRINPQGIERILGGQTAREVSKAIERRERVELVPNKKSLQ